MTEGLPRRTWKVVEAPRLRHSAVGSGDAMNFDLRRRLKAFADDMKGPLGLIPLDRVLRRHLDLFEELRRAGATWSQIANALAKAGIRRADGNVFSVGQLSGSVHRQKKGHASASRREPFLHDNAPQPHTTPPKRAASKSRTGETTTPKRQETATAKRPTSGSRLRRF